MTSRINRRAAFTGALVSAAALAVPVSAAIRPKTIEELAMRFRDDCMALDPTITGCWLGFDETITDTPREDRVQSIYFERAHAPFVRKDPVKTKAPTAAEWWDQFSTLTTEQKLEYAKIIRQTDSRFNKLSDYIERTYGGGKRNA